MQAARTQPVSLWMYFVLRLGMLLLLSSVYLIFQGKTEGWRVWFVLGSMAVFSINHFAYMKLRRPLWLWVVFAVDFMVAASYSFVYLGGDYPDQLFVGLVGLSLFFHMEGKWPIRIWCLAAVAFAVSWLTVEWMVLHRLKGAMAVINLSFILFASVVAFLLRSNHQTRLRMGALYEELEASHEQLQAYAARAEELSAAKERVRIARDIHDTVGHTMTSLLVQLQAARKLSDLDPEESRASLLRSEALARSALQDVRLSVKEMREEEGRLSGQSFAAMLRSMASEFSGHTGMEITLDVEGDIELVREKQRHILYRFLQEALTNAHKHGHAGQVTARLTCSGAAIAMDIQDNGRGCDSWSPGFGLQSMQERGEESGGRLVCSSQAGSGFRVRLEWKEEEHDSRAHCG